MLDKNEILLAHIFPTSANPETVNPFRTLNPTLPIKISEKITKTFFYSNFYNFFYNSHYQL